MGLKKRLAAAINKPKYKKIIAEEKEVERQKLVKDFFEKLNPIHIEYPSCLKCSDKAVHKNKEGDYLCDDHFKEYNKISKGRIKAKGATKCQEQKQQKQRKQPAPRLRAQKKRAV